MALFGGVVEVRKEYDARSNLVRRVAIGIDGRVKRDDRFDYDTQSHPSEWRLLDAAGALVVDPQQGHARRLSKTDATGNEIETRYFNAANELACLADGAAIIKRRYDPRHNRTEELFFNEQGKPTLSKSLGIAGRAFEYDARGNCLKERYIDLDASHAGERNGLAGVERRYDNRGRMTEEWWIDQGGHPVVHSILKYAKRRLTYGHGDDPVDAKYEDASGKVLSVVVRVRQMYEGSNGEVGELCVGDRALTVGGDAVGSAAQLRARVREFAVRGESVSGTIRRKEANVDVVWSASALEGVEFVDLVEE